MTGIAFITSTFGEASLKIGDVLVDRSADAAVVDANFLVARERAPKGKRAPPYTPISNWGALVLFDRESELRIRRTNLAANENDLA